MTNRSKSKGTAWEVRLRDFFRENGFPHCERLPTEGSKDRGDLSIPGVVIEAKNAKKIELASWIDELVVEKRNAGAPTGAVIFPRRSHHVGRAYVVLELSDYVELIK